MEIIIAILMYFGIVSPDATATMNQAEMDYLIGKNQHLVEQALKDPNVCEAASTSGYEFDRRED